MFHWYPYVPCYRRPHWVQRYKTLFNSQNFCLHWRLDSFLQSYRRPHWVQRYKYTLQFTKLLSPLETGLFCYNSTIVPTGYSGELYMAQIRVGVTSNVKGPASFAGQTL